MKFFFCGRGCEYIGILVLSGYKGPNIQFYVFKLILQLKLEFWQFTTQHFHF